MKKMLNNIAPMAFALLLVASPAAAQPSRAGAQETTPKSSSTGEKSKTEQRKGQKKNDERVRPRTVVPTGERLEPDETRPAPTGVPSETLANRREQVSEEEQAIVPYYNNFMTSYRLGPEDIISVRVFGQDRYSLTNIIIPPDGKISYPLIKEGVFVTGKSTVQVAEEITRYLEEYILDPKVTVSLDKAMSARFSVIGDVARPGIMTMSRRLTVYEALFEAGGVLDTGDKKKIMLVRQRPDGLLQQIPVDIAAIEKGKLANTQVVMPGDQIFVPGNRLKTFNRVVGLLPVLSFARIFTGGW